MLCRYFSNGRVRLWASQSIRFLTSSSGSTSSRFRNKLILSRVSAASRVTYRKMCFIWSSISDILIKHYIWNVVLLWCNGFIFTYKECVHSDIYIYKTNKYLVLPVGQGLSDQHEKSEVFSTPNFTSPVKSLLLTIFNAALTKKPHMHTPTCLFLHFVFLVMLMYPLGEGDNSTEKNQC